MFSKSWIFILCKNVKKKHFYNFIFKQRNCAAGINLVESCSGSFMLLDINA